MVELSDQLAGANFIPHVSQEVDDHAGVAWGDVALLESHDVAGKGGARSDRAAFHAGHGYGNGGSSGASRPGLLGRSALGCRCLAESQYATARDKAESQDRHGC